MPTIFIRFAKIGKCIFVWAALFLFGSISIGSPVQAQSFKRVYKDGIIYYYFSNRAEGRSIPLDFKAIEHKIIRGQGGGKVPSMELDPAVQEASLNHDLPPALIKAIIKVESNFNPAATSPKGAQGLMQLMPDTAEELKVGNPYDIRENIGGGARYLGMLLQKFDNHLPLALAAYNAGPNRVEKYQGIPPIAETKNFVHDVCANFLKYSGKPLSAH